MKRELGIARCGLACCLCGRNDSCSGCYADDCSGISWCENRKCSIEKEKKGCFDCEEECEKGLLAKIKPQAFRLFIRRYGVEELLNCLEQKEKNGVVYHRDGIVGDYDDFDDIEKLIDFIRAGERA